MTSIYQKFLKQENLNKGQYSVKKQHNRSISTSSDEPQVQEGASDFKTNNLSFNKHGMSDVHQYDNQQQSNQSAHSFRRAPLPKDQHKYEDMFQRYKARKEIIAKSRQDEHDSGSRDLSAHGSGQQKTTATTTYLSYLEKQIEKANTAYLHVDTLREQLGKVRERLEIMELQQTELNQKFNILNQLENQQVNTQILESFNKRLAMIETGHILEPQPKQATGPQDVMSSGSSLLKKPGNLLSGVDSSL